MVTLDEACRKQQLGEGWFANLSEVPRQAISMSVRQILRREKLSACFGRTKSAGGVRLPGGGDQPACARFDLAHSRQYYRVSG